MSYSKAKELLRLADFACSRFRGVTLTEICEHFEVSHRTAQRMTSALSEAFPHAVEIVEDPTRERRWIVREVQLARLRLSGDEELEGLEFAIARLRESGDSRQARALGSLRDRLLAALPVKEARRAEADAEAMLEVHGVAARPGPVVAVAQEVTDAVTAALRGPYRLRFSYNNSQRLVEPYGVLLGARRYLVGRQPEKGPKLRHFRFDRIRAPEVTDEWFARDSAFDLAAHAARAFGSFQDDSQFREVVWRFAPEAADRAAEWRFHPNQQMRRADDGVLEVRFEASGWLEMAWHLYQWGDTVQVIKPKELADLVHASRRSDFDALP
ncbi:WYL domain-containing protein [Mesorhizobium sp. M0999]|uniref:helix-turn-helix transcriptional regulator n=1 Tax=Mesorhizobium sp. M0999 TaxID=2957045 RepID=UPI00333590DD